MKKLLWSLALCTIPSLLHANDQLSEKIFTLKYKVITAKGICWQTCRHSRCEETEYEIFWDLDTFKLISNLGPGMKWQYEQGKSCDDRTINYSSENMPKLMKENANAALQILEGGTPIKIVIYNDYKEELGQFLSGVLSEQD